MAEEQGKKLIPRTIGNRDCNDPTPVDGQPSLVYDYVRKLHNEDDDDIPKDLDIELCDPWYYYNMKVGNLQLEDTAYGNFQGTINTQSWKGFDIKHPNKENHRLRHICLEGPEAGVYIRGRLTNQTVIEIPEYWIGLVDPETITVTLTQIGYSQDLIVGEIEWGRKILVKSGNGANIDCYYTIQAARIDGEKLIVEYEGQTPADYPGDSSQFSISGYDYGRTEA